MPTSKEKSQELIEALEAANFEPHSYSGRGMDGRQCVSLHHVSIWEVARALPASMDIPEPYIDSLGKGGVTYWPTYEWPED